MENRYEMDFNADVSQDRMDRLYYADSALLFMQQFKTHVQKTT